MSLFSEISDEYGNIVMETESHLLAIIHTIFSFLTFSVKWFLVGALVTVGYNLVNKVMV